MDTLNFYVNSAEKSDLYETNPVVRAPSSRARRGPKVAGPNLRQRKLAGSRRPNLTVWEKLLGIGTQNFVCELFGDFQLL